MNQAVAPSTRKLIKQAEAAMQKNRVQEAVSMYEQVLAINPMQVEALHKLGVILHAVGNVDAAAQLYQRAIDADPSYVDCYVLLAMLLESQNQGMEAFKITAHAALNVAPNDVNAHIALANIMLRQQRSHEAVPYIESILPRFGNSSELHSIYCMALKMCYRYAEADAEYEKAKKKWRLPLAQRWSYEMYLPRLYASVEEIDRIRAQYIRSHETFLQEKGRIEFSKLSHMPVFSLAFHNHDNKELLVQHHRLLRQMVPELNYTAPHCKAAPLRTDRPIRVVFISAFMHRHSVGNCYRSAMLYLARQPGFEVVFFNISSVFDAAIQEIVDAGIPMHPVPKNIVAAQQAIAGLAPDIVIYPDIGMNPLSNYLAMARLAPYQCCFQGHPETTGIDTLDYVISSRTYEPEHAEENYTERLLCNSGIDTVFKRPVPPPQWLSRPALGLPEGKKLYVCPMAIQKFHPDFDALLGGILARDPEGVLVLFKDFDQQYATEMLQQRVLSRCDPSRAIFLDWQPLDKLFSIMKEADAILDTIYFGGGTTSQYAFGFGLPIVTMPGRYARGRVIHSYYSVMGIERAPEAASPQEYIELATRLANDKDYYRDLQEQILAKNVKLFEQGNYGPHLVQLLQDIIAQDLEKYRR